MTSNKPFPQLLFLSLSHTHFKNSILLPGNKKSSLSLCVRPHHACVVTLKPADMPHPTAKERECLITSLSVNKHLKSPVLPSSAALQVSLDSSGRADASRGKHGAAPNRQRRISHTALF